MLDKLKNPLFVLRVGLIMSIITFIYIFVDYFKMFSFHLLIETDLIIDIILEILFSMSLTLIIYYTCLLFSKSIKLKFLDRETLFQIGIILMCVIGIKINKEITLQVIVNIVMYILLFINLLLITLNKKFNSKMFIIIEYAFLILVYIFSIINALGYDERLSNVCYITIYHLPIAPFINYLYLYGSSKNRKE